MKLKRFTIKGFRSLKDVSWEPGNLNVLIGPNASGKTNLLRALGFLREAVINDLKNVIVKQGGISTILWDTIVPKMDFMVDVDTKFPKDRIGDALHYELTIEEAYWGHEIIREALASSNKGVAEWKYLEKTQQRAFIHDAKGAQVEVPLDQIKDGQTLISQTSKPTSTWAIFRFSDFLGKWQIYQELNVKQDAPVRKAAITRREVFLEPNGDNLISVLHTLYSSEREFKTELNDAMRAAFGNDFEELEFPPAEDQRIQMRVRWKSLKTAHSTANLSEGTLKFLMLLSILANNERGTLVAIDEPETYLHPSMFPIVAELAAEASKSTQIIFTTHSPEFLTAIGSHNPQTTVMQNVHGASKLSILDGNDLKRWLEKYKLGELFISGDLEALA